MTWGYAVANRPCTTTILAQWVHNVKKRGFRAIYLLHFYGMNYLQRINTALEKDAENVSVLAHLPEERLDKKLALINRQVAAAKKYEQRDALELLKIWEAQVLNAKELKLQLNPAENLLVDVEMELPELAAFDMIEKRQELLKLKLSKEEFSENRQK